MSSWTTKERATTEYIHTNKIILHLFRSASGCWLVLYRIRVRPSTLSSASSAHCHMNRIWRMQIVYFYHCRQFVSLSWALISGIVGCVFTYYWVRFFWHGTATSFRNGLQRGHHQRQSLNSAICILIYIWGVGRTFKTMTIQWPNLFPLN